MYYTRSLWCGKYFLDIINLYSFMVLDFGHCLQITMWDCILFFEQIMFELYLGKWYSGETT